jgi:hypothetical protein
MYETANFLSVTEGGKLAFGMYRPATQNGSPVSGFVPSIFDGNSWISVYPGTAKSPILLMNDSGEMVLTGDLAESNSTSTLYQALYRESLDKSWIDLQPLIFAPIQVTNVHVAAMNNSGKALFIGLHGAYGVVKQELYLVNLRTKQVQNIPVHQRFSNIEESDFVYFDAKFGISENDDVVASIRHSDGRQRAVVWNPRDGILDFGLRSNSLGISSTGTVILNVSRTDNSDDNAAIYTKAGGLRSIGEELGFYSSIIASINSSGTILIYGTTLQEDGSFDGGWYLYNQSTGLQRVRDRFCWTGEAPYHDPPHWDWLKSVTATGRIVGVERMNRAFFLEPSNKCGPVVPPTVTARPTLSGPTPPPTTITPTLTPSPTPTKVVVNTPSPTPQATATPVSTATTIATRTPTPTKTPSGTLTLSSICSAQPQQSLDWKISSTHPESKELLWDIIGTTQRGILSINANSEIVFSTKTVPDFSNTIRLFEIRSNGSYQQVAVKSASMVQCATPTPTATFTATQTPEPTATITPLPTETPRPPQEGTATPEPTTTATPLPSATFTASPTPTITPTPQATFAVQGTFRSGNARRRFSPAQLRLLDTVTFYISARNIITGEVYDWTGRGIQDFKIELPVEGKYIVRYSSFGPRISTTSRPSVYSISVKRDNKAPSIFLTWDIATIRTNNRVQSRTSVAASVANLKARVRAKSR